jgi:hypothetical protein
MIHYDTFHKGKGFRLTREGFEMKSSISYVRTVLYYLLLGGQIRKS